MSLGVYRFFQFHHVRVLLGVYVLVREQHLQLVDEELHFRFAWSSVSALKLNSIAVTLTDSQNVFLKSNV